MEKKIKRGIDRIKPLCYNLDYLIDESGNIYSKKGTIMKPVIDEGRARVKIALGDGKSSRVQVHQAVMHTFKEDEYQEGMVVTHLDGDRLNNDIDNLVWHTPAENSNYLTNILNRKNGKAKSIIGIDRYTNEIKYEFESLADAGRYFADGDPRAARIAAHSITRAKNGYEGRKYYKNCRWEEKE